MSIESEPRPNTGKKDDWRSPELPETKHQYAAKRRKNRLPMWMRDLPRPFGFPSQPDEQYKLVSDEDLDQLHREGLDAEAVERIRADRDFLEYELMRLFRTRDHEAAREQNRYRLFQITFITLATAATVLGSLQALMLVNRPDLVWVFAFAETAVALLTTFVATVRGSKPPLMAWLDNRRRAEHMRREYFRFIMRLPPYHNINEQTPYQLKTELSKRAADINKGSFPPEPTILNRSIQEANNA